MIARRVRHRYGRIKLLNQIILVLITLNVAGMVIFPGYLVMGYYLQALLDVPFAICTLYIVRRGGHESHNSGI